ncbi:MAG TPA: response regulator, partial [Puia sp.]|nr:response regulator [Puia sp.]
MSKGLKILLLGDNPADAEIVKNLLEKEMTDCKFRQVSTKNDYVAALDQFQPDVILADNALSQFNTAEALELTKPGLGSVPFILVTGTVSEELAADIIKMGVRDHVLKDR